MKTDIHLCYKNPQACMQPNTRTEKHTHPNANWQMHTNTCTQTLNLARQKNGFDQREYTHWWSTHSHSAHRLTENIPLRPVCAHTHTHTLCTVNTPDVCRHPVIPGSDAVCHPSHFFFVLPLLFLRNWLINPDTGMWDYSQWHNMSPDSQHTHTNPSTTSCTLEIRRSAEWAYITFGWPSLLFPVSLKVFGLY